MEWLVVDHKGLAKILERQGKAQAVRELVANALDTDAKMIRVLVESIPGRRGAAKVEVEDDDPLGFSKLEHAWTLFAESDRKADPGKRGRFNMGEKMVLALCEEAEIQTVAGSVRFDAEGRHRGKKGREAGSLFTAIMKFNREDVEQSIALVRSLLVPEGVVVTVNGEVVRPRRPVRTFEATLPTELADAEGFLRRSARKTNVRLVEAGGDETPTLYELGVPILPLDGGERWHVDVGQKVPLTIDRENVSVAFMRELRVALLNTTHDMLRTEDATAPWARQAVGDQRSDVSAVREVAKLRFGKDAVSADPSDREAEKISVSKGSTLVHGGMASKDEWASFRRAEVLPAAGKVNPSPKAYGEGDKDVEIIPREKWTDDQKAVVAYMSRVGALLIDKQFETKIVKTTNAFVAAYGRTSGLTLNVFRLGHQWFRTAASGSLDALHELMIHELGHESSGDHLSSEYHDALCRLGARLTRLAVDQPLALQIRSVVNEQAQV